MNDNVLKLLLSVGIDIHVDPEYGQVLENFTLRDAEKFAELIVKECAEVCQQVTNSGDYTPDQQYASAACRDQVKRHFGVK